MPVDKFGWIVGEDEPAHPTDRYAVPINRKPKRKNKDSLLLAGALALILLLIVSMLVATSHRTHVTAAQPTPTVTDELSWPIIFSMNNTGNWESKPFTVSSPWQLSWQCDKNLSVAAIYQNGQHIQVTNITDCTLFPDVVQMKQAGTIHLEIQATGFWSIAIREKGGVQG